MSLKISSHSQIKGKKPLLFLDICSKIYCKFVLVHLDYKAMQFTYTNCNTNAGHGLPLCRKH